MVGRQRGARPLTPSLLQGMCASHLRELVPIVWELLIAAQVNDLIVAVQAQAIVPQRQNCGQVTLPSQALFSPLRLLLWEGSCARFLQRQGQQAQESQELHGVLGGGSGDENRLNPLSVQSWGAGSI